MPSDNMQECIDYSVQCHRICLEMAMNRCLEQGRQARRAVALSPDDELRADVPNHGGFHDRQVCAACANLCRLYKRLRSAPKAAKRSTEWMIACAPVVYAPRAAAENVPGCPGDSARAYFRCE